MAKLKLEKIRFHYLDTAFYFPSRTLLKQFILKIFRTEKVQLDAINYVFCSDNYLLSLNRSFLKHNTYTDIITFQYSPIAQPVLSDVYISIDRLRENAKRYDTSFLNELYRVMFHGALHLCGYGDKTESEKIEMRSKENFYLDKYVPRGTSYRSPHI